MLTKTRFMTAVVLGLVWICPLAARAQTQSTTESPMRFADRPLSINLVLGVATPTGEAGITAEYSFSDRFAAGVGAGESLLGIQLAAFGRVRLVTWGRHDTAHGLDFVAAFSTGEYEGIFFSGDSGTWKERAYWVQNGIDYEHVTRSGFHFATGIGVAVLVGSSDVRQDCVDSCPKPPQSVWPTIHVTFGFSPSAPRR